MERENPKILPFEETSPRARSPGAGRFALALVPIGLVTGVGVIAYAYLALEDITVLYVLAIMLAALLGRGPAFLAASVAVIAFDVCFVPPRWTLAVADARHVLTFAVMFIAGTVISTLITKLRQQEGEAIAREQRTAALLAFMRDVAHAVSEEDIGVVVARHLEGTLDIAATALVSQPDVSQPDVSQSDGLVPIAGIMPLAEQELEVARACFAKRRVTGHGTDEHGSARVLCVPMLAGDSCVGVIAIQRRPSAPPMLGQRQRQLVDALARQAGIAIARLRLAEEAKQTAVRAHTEELRSSLLSAVSHDLRTPLAVITGAATSLRDDADKLAPAAREELLSSIVTDARRLERVLANILQLTRVETGLRPAREPVPAEEVVGSVLTRLEETLGDRRVELDVGSDVVLDVDPVLFEQALINLIENSLKHGAPPLMIRAAREGDSVVVEVSDRGCGLPAGDPARLFDKFVRASSAPGVGLGLAVVRAIVEAHGGRVSAQNRDGGGATFRIVLPTAAS